MSFPRPKTPAFLSPVAPAVAWEQLPSGRVRHRFEWLMLLLALLIIPVVLVEEAPLSRPLELAAAAANWLIWVGFLAELALIVAVAPRNQAALRAHWFELLIVAVTPSFLAMLASGVTAWPLVRLLRLLRIGVLGGRAVSAQHVFTSRQNFRYIALLAGFLVAAAGLGISIVDPHDFPHSGVGMWWAITTVTTVGYGDVVPHATAGRIVAVLLMFVGVGFTAILTATFASAYVSRDQSEERHTLDNVMETLERIEGRLNRLEQRLDGRRD